MSYGSGFREIPHPRQILEMLVLRPQRCFTAEGGCVDETIRHMQRVMGGIDGERKVQFHDFARLNQTGALQSLGLTTLAEHFLEDLVDRDDRHDEILRVLDGCRKIGGAWGVGQVFQPRRGINDVVIAHNRSSSRSMVVSMPLRNPRISAGLRTGIISMRSR